MLGEAGPVRSGRCLTAHNPSRNARAEKPDTELLQYPSTIYIGRRGSVPAVHSILPTPASVPEWAPHYMLQSLEDQAVSLHLRHWAADRLNDPALRHRLGATSRRAHGGEFVTQCAELAKPLLDVSEMA